MVLIELAPNRGRSRIRAGLSETSRSLKFGGIGSGSSLNTSAWRGAGFAALGQLEGGFGFGSGGDQWGAV